MSTVNKLIRQYLAIWNERDTTTRNTLIKTTLTENSTYSDPDHAALRGHSELTHAITRAQEEFGDMLFTLGTVINAHHDTVLFTWKLGTVDGDGPVATGYDVVELTGDRIRRVVGFFE